MKRSVIILFFLFSQFIKAQDVHYSQFEKTKLLINSSLISSQEEDYEIQLQRRSQWSSITIPFNTFSLSFTLKEVYKTLSLGGTILNDVAGDSHFSTDAFLFSVGNSVISKNNLFAFSVQTGFSQRSINYDRLIFFENEGLENLSFSFFDFGIGISNYKKIDSSFAFLIGLSSYHLNKPKQSLTSNDEVVLTPKYIIHSNTYININSKTEIIPAMYTSLQGQQQEFVIGSGGSYRLNSETRLKTGIYTRMKDAIFITLGMQKENLEVIISYDINTSTLANASDSMGGIEFSISYGWSRIKENKKESLEIICPKYL